MKMKGKIFSIALALVLIASAFIMPVKVSAATNIYKGVDVFEYDNISDYQALKSTGVSVIIQKATQGLYHNDSLLQYRYNAILENGFKIGFYHFANNSGDPVGEAKHFLSQISGLHSDTVVWLDIENESNWNKSEAIDYANKFINYVQSQNYSIGIYTGLSMYYEYLCGNIPSNIPIWLASYGKQPAQYPNLVSWQYSESGSLNGVIGNIDLDYFNDSIFSGTVTRELTTLEKQNQALQYDLNLDYNAGLSTDGKIGEATLDALNGIYPLLVKGHRSHVVEFLQQKMVQYGYLKVGTYTPGLLNEQTFQSITELQKNWNRATSGRMNLETWSVFLNN